MRLTTGGVLPRVFSLLYQSHHLSNVMSVQICLSDLPIAALASDELSVASSDLSIASDVLCDASDGLPVSLALLVVLLWYFEVLSVYVTFCLSDILVA